jgi:hypothetical protein
MRACRLGVAATLCLIAFCGEAAAEEFSILCTLAPGSGPHFYYTFDDQRKRVIEYVFENGRLGGPVFTGTIKAISTEEIQFDLFIYFNLNAKMGDFTLNRKEGWVGNSSAHGQPGTCRQTSLRTVMDLWESLPQDFK